VAFPSPQLGLVISYAYLWHQEYRAGREEGVKDRPCVIILSVRDVANGTTVVRVAPITHAMPDNPNAAMELPQAVKRHLGLDTGRSWIIIDEINEFTWPGFDLRPVTSAHDSFAFGFLPPRLFATLMTKLGLVWEQGRGKATPRD
jgi:hypothetical protein